MRTKNISKLVEHGVISAPLKKGELAVGIALYESVQMHFSGIWTDNHVKITIDNAEALGSAIVAQIAPCTKSNN